MKYFGASISDCESDEFFGKNFDKIRRRINAKYEYNKELSAQLSVINQDRIASIGDLEVRINRLKSDYKKHRQEINSHIEENNRLVSLWEQAQLYKELSPKNNLSAAEQLQFPICRQAMESNDIHTFADIDRLRERTENLSKKISALKENLEGCRQRYDVYSDIAKTYAEISEGDYISKLVEKEKNRKAQEAKKNRRKL